MLVYPLPDGRGSGGTAMREHADKRVPSSFIMDRMLLRKALPYTSAALLAAMIYTGWTFYSRWAEARRADAEESARRRELDRQTLNMIGTDLKILTFYSSPQTIQRGSRR